MRPDECQIPSAWYSQIVSSVTFAMPQSRSNRGHSFEKRTGRSLRLARFGNRSVTFEGPCSFLSVFFGQCAPKWRSVEPTTGWRLRPASLNRIIAT